MAPSPSSRVRNVVLALLVLQTTSIVLLMRYSKTAGATQYLSSAAVFAAELLKLPVCLGMAAWTLGGLGPLRELLSSELLGNFGDTCKCAVPAVAYTIQGNLLFLALTNLDAPTYQVAYQSKTLFTALFSRCLLGRKLQSTQWIALLLLCAGTVLVSDDNSGHQRETTSANQRASSLGFAAVFGAAVLSSSSSVYFEKMLKKPSTGAAQKASLWLRNIQLGVFATPLAGAAMMWADGPAVRAGGALQGFDAVVWLVVLLNGLGGLLVAATMKYADNIVKCFAAALAILTGTLLSVPVFGFELSPSFAAGVGCTAVASTLYAWAPALPARCVPRTAATYDLLPTRSDCPDRVR